MPTQPELPRTCAACGAANPPDALVCMACRAVLPRQAPRGLGWLNTSLIVIIAVGVLYAIYLAYKVLVLHAY